MFHHFGLETPAIKITKLEKIEDQRGPNWGAQTLRKNSVSQFFSIGSNSVSATENLMNVFLKMNVVWFRRCPKTMNGKFIASDKWVNSRVRNSKLSESQMNFFPEAVQVKLTRVSRKNMLFLRQFWWGVRSPFFWKANHPSDCPQVIGLTLPCHKWPWCQTQGGL